MSLKLKVEDINSVPENQRSLYIEKMDGEKKVFVLDAEVEDTTNLKTALASERKARADFEKKLAAVKDVDPDEYARLKQEDEQRKQKKLKDEGDFQSLEKQLREKHTQDLEKERTVAGRYRGALEKKLIDADATAAINALDGRVKLLLPHIKETVKVVEEEGEFVVRVLGKDGKPRISKKTEGFMTIEELVAEMAEDEDFMGAFKGRQQSGPGAKDGQKIIGGKFAHVKTKADFKSDKEASEFIDEYGPDAYNKLPRK